ncbi:CHAT domain-containing protein [Mycena sp. CBHHK59/15]|nr:CHAT domain-containing protein [Mycena sp. CBHHK59/15]
MREAIQLYREALALHPSSHPDHGKCLNNLANAVKTRFDQRGDQQDIDEATELHREALAHHPSPHANHRHSLNSLASAILARFEQWRDPQDINEVIELHREALAHCPLLHPDRGSCLNQLANAVWTRFQEGADPRDINEAVELHREAVDLYPLPHPNHVSAVNDLAVAIRTRFQQSGKPEDIVEVIQLHRDALALLPAPHPARGSSLSNLANALFEQHGDLQDINEAIKLHREALILHTSPHTDRGRSLNSLGHCLAAAHVHANDTTYLDEAMSVFQQAATYSSSTPINRLQHAANWANIATQYHHSSSLEAYHTAVNLLPRLAALNLDVRARQQILSTTRSAGVASGAASCAITLGDHGLAVEFLEASRSVFWTQALHLRTPLDDLQTVNPRLASKLSKLSSELEQASFRDNSRNPLTAAHKVRSIDAEGVRCRRLNDEWEDVVNSVRLLPGFQGFMRPESMATLRQAAVTGPIVIINVGISVSHALIVKCADQIQCVPLPLMTRHRADYLVDLLRALSGSSFDMQEFLMGRQHADDGELNRSISDPRLLGGREVLDNTSAEDVFRDLLRNLWTEIGHPVINALNLKKSVNPTRLWWCPTGPLTFLPIHAAGISGEDGTDCVSDYVISSYTPTLTALLNPPTDHADWFKMTTVIEPDAPDNSYLPGAQAELGEIKKRVPDQWHTAVGDTTQATVETAVSNLQRCSIAHFACHGIQDLESPLNSGLVLSNGRLRISEIMREPENDVPEQRRSSMSLAFLSACETAKGDNNTPDEAMHLAATLLFAGFRSVVGTMWRMDDRDGPKITATFYEHLFRNCDATSDPPVFPDFTDAAEALHLAVAELRKEPDISLMRWVPFVHHGL